MIPKKKLEVLLAKIVFFHADVVRLEELSEEQRRDYKEVLNANTHYSLAHGSEEALMYSLAILGDYYEKWIRRWEG